MSKYFSRIFCCLFSFVLLFSVLSGCGRKMSVNEYDGNTNDIVKEEVQYESVDITSDSKTVTDNRKIIENIDLSVQTKEFDELIEGLNKKITELGGYIESSNIYGREYDSYNTRNARYTVRIPADKSGNFTDYMSENSVIVNKSITF